MEEWRPSSEEESKDEKTSAKKRGRNDFFSSLMERLEALRHNREGTEEKEEDEDDEESDSKEKKFSRVGRFLRRLLAKPAESEASPVTDDALIPAQESVPNPQEPARLMGELRVPHDTKPRVSDKAEAPDLTETSETYNAPHRPEHQNHPETDYEPDDNAAIGANAEVQSTERQAESDRAESQPPEPQTISATTQRAEQVIFERTVEQPRTERVVERRDPSLLPLIALEYIGRRRADKKLRKEVVGLEKQVERGQKALDKLQTMQPAAMPRMNSYEQNLQRLTQKFETPQPPKFEQVTQASKIEIPAQRTPNERIITERPETIVTSNVMEKNYIPDTDRLAELHTRPEVVLNQVVEAVEHDVAVEKAYERRQEVRDEPGAGTVSGGGAQTVGAVMAANLANNPIMQSQHQATIKLLAQAADQRQANQQSLYKHAATAGVAAAGVILVFALVAYATLG